MVVELRLLEQIVTVLINGVGFQFKSSKFQR